MESSLDNSRIRLPPLLTLLSSDFSVRRIRLTTEHSNSTSTVPMVSRYCCSRKLMLPARMPPPDLLSLQPSYRSLMSYFSMLPACLASKSHRMQNITNSTMPATSFLTALGLPSLANQKAAARKTSTGKIYALHPNSPNRTPLTALPPVPIRPKLQQNKNTMATNSTISPISWKRALSCMDWVFVFFFRAVLLFLPLVVLVVFLLEEDVFLPPEAAILINLTSVTDSSIPQGIKGHPASDFSIISFLCPLVIKYF